MSCKTFQIKKKEEITETTYNPPPNTKQEVKCKSTVPITPSEKRKTIHHQSHQKKTSKYQTFEPKTILKKTRHKNYKTSTNKISIINQNNQNLF